MRQYGIIIHTLLYHFGSQRKEKKMAKKFSEKGQFGMELALRSMCQTY